jgi:DNA-directed RNA polymerase subunit RPC12/RpoP
MVTPKQWLFAVCASLLLVPILVASPVGAAVGVALIMASLWLPARPPPRSGICRHCGYDLTGNISGRCPECGLRVLARARDMIERSEE